MIRKRCILSKPQAVAIIQIFRRNQLADLAIFLLIKSIGKKHAYKLCLDCPEDSHARLQAKLLDVAPTLVETDKQAIESIVWETYDDAEIQTEHTGMTPEFKTYVEEKNK
jgi:hypothetical protein